MGRKLEHDPAPPHSPGAAGTTGQDESVTAGAGASAGWLDPDAGQEAEDPRTQAEDGCRQAIG